MHYIQLLALAAATATTIAALPLQEVRQRSAPLGKHFKFIIYDDSEDSAPAYLPFDYNLNGDERSNHLAKRFFYNYDDDSISESLLGSPETATSGHRAHKGNSNDHGPGKHLIYSSYDDRAGDESPEWTDAYETDGNGHDLVKRFYYTHYSDDDNMEFEPVDLENASPVWYEFVNGKEANAVSHDGKHVPTNHHHHTGASTTHGKTHKVHGKDRTHHDMSAWASMKEILHLN